MIKIISYYYYSNLKIKDRKTAYRKLNPCVFEYINYYTYYKKD